MAKPSKEVRESIAIGMERKGDGYVITTYRIQGEKVVGRQETQPDVKAIAIETFKRTAVKELMTK